MKKLFQLSKSEKKSSKRCLFCLQEMFLVHDPPGYINPSLQNILFTNLTPDELLAIAKRIGDNYNYGNLSLTAGEFPGSFPISGVIHGLNNRLMVSLSCQI
jgi:hypothetical protein